jgi:hypothetical protein
LISPPFEAPLATQLLHPITYPPHYAMNNDNIERLREQLRETSNNVEHRREQLRDTLKYADKWEVLKPLIEHLFLDQRYTVPKIREVIKALFDFPAK